MYDDRKEKFSFKNFFLTILIVLLFVFLMLWLFPTRGYVNKLHEDNNQNQQVFDLDRLSVLYDEIFANNVSRMKDAAIGYFTNERLPQKVKESKKLTLKEMYDLHLVLKMKDKDGNPCDTQKSYVEITKYTEEYRLKVNLSCGKEEDYIIVYLGCYNYCPGGVCEKETPIPSKKTEEEMLSCKAVKGIYYDKNGKMVSKSEYEKSCGIIHEPDKYYCKVVDGKYYGKSGNIVDKSTYDNECTTPVEPDKYYCKVVDGKYYGKSGNVVDKSTYDNECTTPVEPDKYYCKVVNGKYYGKNGNVVDKSTYNNECTTPVEPDKYYCKVVGGIYYGKNGNIVTKSTYEDECTTKKYLYEYKNNPQPVTTCSAWSEWQKIPITQTSSIQVETKKVNEITGYKTYTVQTGVNRKTITKKVTEKYIKDYTKELVVVGSRQVKVGTTTKTTTKKVAVGTTEVYAGIGSGTKVPTDTSTVHYKNVKADTPTSCSYCENETKYTWEVWNVETVYDVRDVTEEVPVYKTIYEYAEKQVPIYGYRTVDKEEVVEIPIIEERKEEIREDVTYYRSKTCTTKTAEPDIKWSESKEDKDLINKGYKFTGNVKQV